MTTMLGEWVTRAAGVYRAGVTAVPEAVRQVGIDSVVDTIAVMYGGAREDAPRAAAAYVREFDVGRCATVFGHHLRPEHAVLVNATAAHAQDFDDAATALIGGHASAVLVPVALAVGEHIGAAGQDVLTALVCGCEVTFALGACVNPHLYEAGFHPTSILCPIGAAVTAGLLLGLSDDQLVHAASLGCSVSSGIKGNFGSMAKALHVGWAAHGGITAARLAASGATGNPDVVERQAGFAQVYGAASAELGRPFRQPWYLVDPGIGIRKAWPSCASTHATIECAQTLATDNDFDVRDVESVEVELPSRRIPHTNRPVVRSRSEARFSQQFCAAAALVHGQLRPEHFSAESLADPRIAALMRKVVLHGDDALNRRDPDMRTGADFCARMTVHTRLGRHTAEIEQPLGTSGRPLTGARLAEKFTACVDPVLGSTTAAALLATLEKLPAAPTLSDLLPSIGDSEHP